MVKIVFKILTNEWRWHESWSNDFFAINGLYPSTDIPPSGSVLQGRSTGAAVSCWHQFLSMAFAQLTYRESLRGIETCVRSLGPKLYHSGLGARISRSTLADANEHRSWQIYHDLALVLIERARPLYRDEKLISELQSALYAFDSTIIDLCLSLFPWARGSVYQKTTAGIKVHTLLDIQSQLPDTVRVTAANVHDVRMLDDLTVEPGAHYVMDRVEFMVSSR